MVFGEFQAKNFASIVATIFRSFSGNETSSCSTVNRQNTMGQFHTKRTLQNSHSI